MIEITVRAETAAAAARAGSFSSSGDSLTTLLRGGAVDGNQRQAVPREGELADTPPARNSSDEQGRKRKLVASADGNGAPATALKAVRRGAGAILPNSLASAQDPSELGEPFR